MDTLEANSFSEFEDAINNLHPADDVPQEDEKPTSYYSNYLFRGQGDSRWRLDTTLERYISNKLSFFEYFRAMAKGKSEIETFTGRGFPSFPDYSDYRKWTRDNDKFGMGNFPGYDYMAYVRHHGFPSPLLDWSQSPYIALYFAFINVDPAKTEKVSVFAYQEWVGGGKSWSSGDALIQGLGHNVKSHPRHFQQQSEYTICMKFDVEWLYANHEDVFSRNSTTQDLLYKIDIPSNQKEAILRKLLNFNIHDFSLFGSEDSLMKSIALKNLLLT